MDLLAEAKSDKFSAIKSYPIDGKFPKITVRYCATRYGTSATLGFIQLHEAGSELALCRISQSSSYAAFRLYPRTCVAL